jgi:hypothetical protein
MTLDSSHTLTQGQLFLTIPLDVSLAPDGTFTLPPGTASFLANGLVDGQLQALAASNTGPLTGHYDQARGVFDLSGSAHAGAADVTLMTNFTFAFVNRPPRADAGPDQVVECSAGMPPAGEVHLSAVGSTDPDGRADIALGQWIVSNHGAADVVRSARGETVLLNLPLGTYDAKLVIVDSHGSFGVDAAAITVHDTTPPRITIERPSATDYPHSVTLILAYDVDDVCTGVNEFTPTLDGATILAGHGLAGGQAISLLTELGLGSHILSISARDNAGNTSISSVRFTIIVTSESIREDVAQFLAMGAIGSRKFTYALFRKLDAAAAARERGRCDVASRFYEVFINHLLVNSGAAVDAAAADTMVADAEYLIAHCP